MPQAIAIENGLIALSFLAIAGMIFVGLVRDRTLGINTLGIAAGFIFLFCAAGYAVHAARFILEPYLHTDTSDKWLLLLVDGFTLVAGIGYLELRRRHGMVMRGTHPLLDYQKRLQMAETLRDIGQDIAAQTDFDRLLHHVVIHARELLGADYAAIVTFDQSGRVRRQVTGTGADTWSEDAWNEAVFITDRSGKITSLMSSHHPVVVEDLLSVSAAGWSERTVHRAEGGRAVLAVPICRGNDVAGSLMVAYRAVREFSADDVSSVAALASQAAVAIDKASLIESLRQADQLKDEFLSAAAHELKTPITAIKGWSEILLGEKRARVDEQKALETIHRGAQRIARLSDDLVAVMRLRPVDAQIDRVELDLGQLVRDSAETELATGHTRHVKLRVDGSLRVEADRDLIAEVISRLIEHAVRYSPDGKQVEVSAGRSGATAIVSVTNYGAGVAPERRSHIFEPFYEPVPAGTEGYVGTISLGLYLSKRIVEAHGGQIWYADGPNGRPTFSFSLALKSTD